MRAKNDYYPTDAKITGLLTDRVELSGGILEPCAGDGRMAAALVDQLQSRVDVMTNDITYPTMPGVTRDATKAEFWEQYNREDSPTLINWVVTNPPFSVAPQIIPLAYKNARRGVAMLLRLTYLEPCNNRALWLQSTADHLRLVMPVNPRPQFKEGSKGTDSCTVAWFVWDKLHSWKGLGVPCPFHFATAWATPPDIAQAMVAHRGTARTFAGKAIE